MTKSAQIRARVEEIAKELQKGAKRENVIAKFSKKFQLSTRQLDNYIQKAQSIVEMYQQKAQEAAIEVTIQQAKEDALNGIKTKNQRIKEKQADIDLIREAVKKGTTKDTIVHQGVPIEIDRPLTEIEKATMLKRAAEIESEISKIEGDYAAVKQDVKVDDLRTWTINPK